MLSGTVLGAIGSLTAAGIAAYTVWFQKFRYEKEREPLLSPMIQRFHLEDIKLKDDWETQKKVDKKWAETCVTLANFGSTPIIDIEYSYQLINYEYVKNNIETFNNIYKDEEESAIVEKEYNYVKIEDAPDKNSDTELRYPYLYVSGPGISSVNNVIHHYALKADALRPGEEVELKLPSYFLIINNYILISTRDIRETKYINFEPELKLFVHCTDVEQRKWIFEFKIFLDVRNKIESNKNVSNYHITLAFDFVKSHRA
ncbi:hypothetical protein [uncultured Marinococcus sp.]|uniref:hypothetical protein n=1 Tax=uncultured Marinococcus sp. TaxID=487012 RepID=UPI002629E7CF|nr:hypothetical protein [uncultured Marinococcus sp.]